MSSYYDYYQTAATQQPRRFEATNPKDVNYRCYMNYQKFDSQSVGVGGYGTAATAAAPADYMGHTGVMGGLGGLGGGPSACGEAGAVASVAYPGPGVMNTPNCGGSGGSGQLSLPQQTCHNSSVIGGTEDALSNSSEGDLCCGAPNDLASSQHTPPQSQPSTGAYGSLPPASICPMTAGIVSPAAAGGSLSSVPAVHDDRTCSSLSPGSPYYPAAVTNEWER